MVTKLDGITQIALSSNKKIISPEKIELEQVILDDPDLPDITWQFRTAGNVLCGWFGCDSDWASDNIDNPLYEIRALGILMITNPEQGKILVHPLMPQ